MIRLRDARAALLLLVVALAGCQQMEALDDAEPTIEAALEASLEGESPLTVYEPVFEPVDCWWSLPESQRVDCGYLIVPEDRALPGGPEVRLAVAILRHPDGRPEPDPILRLHGGPGGGYLSVMELAWMDDASLFGADRDVIAFDQRGQGLSEPSLDCPEVGRAYFEASDYEVDGEQMTRESFVDYMASRFGACYERLRQDHHLSAYDSPANAADAADLMRALGYESYNIHASSYGTTVAAMMMRDHPEGIRSVVLDAPSGLTEPESGHLRSMRQAFEELLASCAADAACSGAFPDLRDRWIETLERLDEDPPTIEAFDDVTGERFEVVLNAANATMPLRLSLASASALRTVPLYIQGLSQGDYELAAKGWGGVLARAATHVGWGAWMSVRCAEPDAAGDEAALEALLPESPMVEAFFDHGPMGGKVRFRACERWPVERLTAEDVEPVVSDIPTLMLVGQIDAATDPEAADEIAANLSQVYGIFVFPALGHIVGLGEHDCPTAIEVSFFDDPSSEPDSSCIADMPGPAFLLELGGQGEIELLPYASELFEGLVPAGWNELQPGMFARSDPDVDKTLLAELAAPNEHADAMTSELLGELGVTSLPEPIRTIPTDRLTWSIHAPAGTVPMLVARAETDAVTYLVMLVSSRAEQDMLAEAVLFPAIQALTPIED